MVKKTNMVSYPSVVHSLVGKTNNNQANNEQTKRLLLCDKCDEENQRDTLVEKNREGGQKVFSEEAHLKAQT